MKTLIAPMLATSSFATILACGLIAALPLNAPYQPHHFQQIDASIWSDTPTVVIKGEQTYQRVAAATPPESMSDIVATPEPKDVPVTALPAPVIVVTTSVSPCQQRYRSYRAQDNTYQPLGGGPRRPCETDAGAVPVAAASAATQSAAGSAADHGVWCSARYSSYNPSDDTYQPFGGGARRVCQSPVGVASNS